MVSFKTHRMSDTLFAALGQVQRNGVKLIAASGRPVSYIDNVRDFPFDALIGCNGAMTYMGNRLVFSHPIDKEDALAIARISTQNNIPSYTFGKDASIEGINCMNERSSKIRDYLQLRVPATCDIVRLCEENDIYECTTYVTKEEEERYFHPVLKNVAYIRWHPMFTDIDTGEMDKGKALAEVLDYWGFDLGQSVAFGDGDNDIPMIQAAGIGYAMGGASQAVIDVADRTTLSVEEDGVVIALKELGLL